MPAFQIGAFAIEPARNVIRYGSDEHRIEPKIMDVLCMLAKASGEVVTRADLIDAVWGVEHGADESLTRAISLLRATFRQNEPDTKLIETVPRRGYRLAVDMSEISRGAHNLAEETHSRRTITEETHVTGSVPRREAPPNRIRIAAAGIGVAVLALLLLFIGTVPKTETKAPDPTSIAVLPFDNLSADPEIAFFSRGVSEEILNSLAGVDGIRVIGRTSSFSMKDRARSVDEIRSILGVDHLLDGSVRISGERVRITAQLIDAMSGEQVWSESYDRELNDVFGIQAEIASIVENRLRTGLADLSSVEVPPPPAATPDFETYQIYLQGVEAYRRRYVLPEDAAVPILTRVLKMEPDFLPAYAYLAAAHSVAAISQLEVGRFEEAQKSQAETRRIATKVLEQDPENSLALSALGAIHFQNEEFVESRRFYERAIASNPSEETATMFLQALLRCVGDGEAALTVLETAQLYNPTSSSLNRGLARYALEAGDYDKALGHAKLAADYGAEQGLSLAALAAILKGESHIADDYYRAYAIAETEPEDQWYVDALAAGLDPSLRTSWLADLEANGNIGEQILIRHWGEDEIADRLLENASGPDGYMRRQPLPVSRAWSQGAEGYRRSEAFRKVVEHWNLPEYWRVYGFPEWCKPVGSDDFECS